MRIRCKIGIHEWDYTFYDEDDHIISGHEILGDERHCIHCYKRQIQDLAKGYVHGGNGWILLSPAPPTPKLPPARLIKTNLAGSTSPQDLSPNETC